MPRENKTKYAVLALLSRNSLTGYDIKKLVDRSISYFWNENFGHLYTVLRQMEREGLISRQVVRTSGRPDRSVFSITDEGRKVLSNWLLREPESSPDEDRVVAPTIFRGIAAASCCCREDQERKKKRPRDASPFMRAFGGTSCNTMTAAIRKGSPFGSLPSPLGYTGNRQPSPGATRRWKR